MLQTFGKLFKVPKTLTATNSSRLFVAKVDSLGEIKKTLPLLTAQLADRAKTPASQAIGLDSFFSLWQQHKRALAGNEECKKLLSEFSGKLLNSLKHMTPDELIKAVTSVFTISTDLRFTLSPSQITQILDSIPKPVSKALDEVLPTFVYILACMAQDGCTKETLAQIGNLTVDYILNHKYTYKFNDMLNVLHTWAKIGYHNPAIFEEITKRVLTSFSLLDYSPASLQLLLTCAINQVPVNAKLLEHLFSKATAAIDQYDPYTVIGDKLDKSKYELTPISYAQMFLCFFDYGKRTGKANEKLNKLMNRFISDEQLADWKKWDPLSLFYLVRGLNEAHTSEQYIRKVGSIVQHAIQRLPKDFMVEFAKELSKMQAVKGLDNIKQILSTYAQLFKSYSNNLSKEDKERIMKLLPSIKA